MNWLANSLCMGTSILWYWVLLPFLTITMKLNFLFATDADVELSDLSSSKFLLETWDGIIDDDACNKDVTAVGREAIFFEIIGTEMSTVGILVVSFVRCWNSQQNYLNTYLNFNLTFNNLNYFTAIFSVTKDSNSLTNSLSSTSCCCLRPAVLCTTLSSISLPLLSSCCWAWLSVRCRS